MEIAIIGSSESKFISNEKSLNAEEIIYYTVCDALKKADLDIKDIGTVIQAGDDILDGLAISHTVSVEPSGSFLKEESKIEEDGAFALFYAIQKVISEFDVAMIVACSKSSSSSLEHDPNKKPIINQDGVEVSGSWYYNTQMDPFYLRPLGIDLLTYHALQCRYFLDKSNLSEADINKILIKNKKHGMANENAPFSGEYTLDDINNSGYYVEPLSKLSMPLQTDGCSVLIISKEDWKKKNRPNHKLKINGLGLSSEVYYPGFREFYSSPSTVQATEKALKMSGKHHRDIKIAELYDLFHYQEAILYKDIFGWDYKKIKENIDNEVTSSDGALPVNLSGGISCAHPVMAAGLSRVIHLCNWMEKRDLPFGVAHSQSGLGMQSNIVYCVSNKG